MYLLTVPDPVGESLQKKLAPDLYWRTPNHLRVFERDEFDRLVIEAGLTIEATNPLQLFLVDVVGSFLGGRGAIPIRDGRNAGPQPLEPDLGGADEKLPSTPM